MAVSSVYLANKASKPSQLILVADSDFYFKDTTTVTSMTDSDPANPVLTAVSSKPLGPTKRRLLIRYKVTPRPRPPVVTASGDVESGAITVTLNDPTTTTVVGVAYVDEP